MAKKGQVLVFENVLIFTMGVAIFVMCYTVFMIYQTQFTDQGTSDQLGQIEEYISSNIIMMAGKDSNSTVVLQIPKTLGGEPYYIKLTEDGLNITGRYRWRFSSLSNLPVVLNPRDIVSMRGRVILKKMGNQITMEGV